MTSQSSDKSPNPDSGVTDSLVPPSWWQWLISALRRSDPAERSDAAEGEEVRISSARERATIGTVETEKQIAWLKMTEEEAKKREEDAKKQHEQRMNERIERRYREIQRDRLRR